MKKTIILIMMFLITIASAMVNADVVSEQKIDDLGIFTAEDTVICEHYSVDNKLYCFGYPTSVQADRFTIWTYDLDTQVIENKTATMPYRPAGSFWGNFYALWYYDDKIWGLSSGERAFSYDIIGDSTTNLSGTNSNLPNFASSSPCCAVDEGTDDVYCAGEDTDAFFKYEMDTDTYTALDNPIIDLTRLNQADMCDYDQTRDKLYWVKGSYTVNSTQLFSYEVYAYDVAGDSHSLIGSFPNITANPSDPTFEGIRNGYCDYVGHNNSFNCFAVDDDNYQYDELFHIDVTTGISGISDVYLHENISSSTCDRINDTKTVCFGGYYDQDNWYESDDLFEITYSDVPPCTEDWQPYYTLCSIFDNQTLLYNDTNQCGTFGDLPVDNGTVSSCNYCTPTWDETSLDCVSGDSERNITYDYTNTCCSDTGLPSDCTIPANTTESCIGVHSSSDIAGVVIDFGVELGIAILPFVGIMVLAFLGLVLIPAYIKRR